MYAMQTLDGSATNLTENGARPIRVFTLGRFSVLRNESPLVFSGKAQKRPMNLLKALIALGGRSVSTHQLATTLWEDTGACDTKHALDMAILRLRKLLGMDQVIKVQDGKVSLDTQHVWVDSHEFERALSKYETCGVGSSEEKLALGEMTIGLYNGIFLQGDEESPWLLGRRDRLHSRFLRLISHHGQNLAQAGKHQQARICYLKALELDPLAEEIYQELMLCLIAQDERAQALEAYRRCRQMLSIVLNVTPSQRTEALAEQARSGTSIN